MPSFQLFILLSMAWLPFSTNAQDCKACLFDGNDPADCIVYGKVGDEIVEWNTGDGECKGYYQIAITGINPTTSCRSINDFVNSLRFGDLQYSDSKLGLGAASEGGAFFYQNTDANNRIDMVDSITINGETTNCAASANNCWTVMKAYFGDNGEGAKEMAQVCETLFNKVRVDRNLEESTLRIRLCMEEKEGNVIISECYPVAQQVKDLMKTNPDLDCSGFGFESPLTSVPGCEKALEEVSSSTASTGGTSTSSTARETSGSSKMWNGMTWAGTICLAAAAVVGFV